MDEKVGSLPGVSGASVWPALVTGLAVSLSAVSVWLLNVTIYPGFTSFCPEARDAATTLGGVASFALALVAMRWPRVLLNRRVPLAVLLVMALSSLGMLAAIRAASPLAATLFACLHSLGTTLGSVLTVCALMGLDVRLCLPVLVCGRAGKYLWMALLWCAPGWLQTVAYVVASLIGVALLVPVARGQMHALAGLDAPSDLRVTNPSSFLPLTHRMFVAILLFNAAFGFAITYGAHDGYPQPTIVAFAAFVVAMLLVFARRSTSLDSLFALAFAFALAGMLLIPTFYATRGAAGVFMNGLLQAGNEVTSAVAWLMVVMLARRNASGALPAVFAMGCAGGLGTELGALSGHLENYLDGAIPWLAALFAGVITFGFALYNYQLARRFSFDEAVAEVRPAVPVSELDEHDRRLPDIDRRCGTLSAERALTPREAEVLALLARGRNAAYIQESLTLSRNTVKSYVARVYAKLDVHSHQELLDLVEAK